MGENRIEEQAEVYCRARVERNLSSLKKMRFYLKWGTENSMDSSLVAGLVAGSSSCLLLYPMEVIRTRMQVAEPSSHRYSSSLQTSVKNIVKLEGVKALYSGVSVGIFGGGITWGGYFYFYNQIQQQLAMRNNKKIHEFNDLEYLGCAMASGGVMVCLTNPMW